MADTTSHYRYDRTRIPDVLRSQERTLAWLARKMGVSRSYVCLIVNGNKPITERFVRDACAALNLPESILFVPSDLPAGTAPVSEVPEFVEAAS